MPSSHGDDEFRRTVGDVQPLKGAKQRIEPSRRSLPTQPVDGPPAVHAPPAGAPIEIGRAAGVDRRTAERLRRGRLPIEARLDLHGFSQDTAHAALTEFITGSVAKGRRCVLIVTGKGAVSQGGGVLRRRVPEWLNLAPCHGHILAIAQSQPQHGGAGALYVLLRRRRTADQQ